MKLASLALRFRWLQLPAGLLVLLLQRAPLLRLMVPGEGMLSGNAPAILRSAFAVAAMGAYNSVAGATVFNVDATPTAATPTSGLANTTFTINGTVGTAMNIGINETGAPGILKSWRVTGTLPTGLSVVGGNPVNVVAPYKMTISGTPSASGTFPVTVTGYDVVGGTGGNNAKITVTFTITGGVSTAPSITTQPAAVTVTAGASAAFTVAASGNPAPTYQWQKSGVNISGATSATYSIASTVTGDAGNYTAVATNTAGSATSTAATLTVNPALAAPTITTSPTDVTVTAGASATFTVAASGNPTPTYQWQKGGANISGATSATYTIASVVAGDVGNYAAVATNSRGSVTSASAALMVNAAAAAPSITTQPAAVTVTAGASAAFTVAASGNPAPTYQWQKGGVNISGATIATYTIASTVAGDAGNYAVVVTNSSGSATSTTATLTVSATLTAPTFTTQPASQSAITGASVTFTAAASGNPAPTYRWHKDAVNISGATSATFTIASVVAGDAASYTVIATNSVGSVTSSAATLTISASLAAPAFTTQPSSTTVIVGEAASFTIVASGNPTPTYQWKKGGVTIAGATSATYTIGSIGTGDAGSYTVVATNSIGAVTSAAASLTVNPAPPVLPTTQIVITGKTVALGIAASTTGTIKWQVSTDSGSTYTDLADNATYRGTTTAVLEILQATNALNNNRYRYQVTLSGQTTASTATTLSVKPAYLLMPVGLKIDSANNLYVTDAAAQVVVKITSDFKIASLAGTAIAMGSADGTGTVARFNEPTDLVINDDGSFLLTDTSNASLRKVTTAGVVTTFAGTSGSKGSADGTGAAARFSAPVGITRDTAGNVYVADQTNHVIRRVTPAGVVTTLAGTAGAAGSTDGTGTAARFNLPTGVAINSTDLIYVADFGSHTLRKVTSSGVVTTFAGTAGTSGSVDGTGAAARFNKPSGLALDSAGNLYVADTGNSTVRKVTPAGVVTTLAGLYQISGLKDGTGASAWFYEPEGLTSDTTGNLYIADTGNAVIRKVTPAGVVTTLALTGTAPVITTQPASSSVTAGNSASFSVVASSEGVLTYQWKKDGTDVAGATAATYAISSTATTSAGSYTVVVSNFLGSVTSSAATLTVNAVVVTPPPSSSGGGGGGGGGAVSSWFIGALGLLLFARRVRRRASFYL